MRLKLEVNTRRVSKRLKAMYLEEIKEAIGVGLARGSELIVKQAQLNLTRGGNVFMGTLRSSIGYKVNVDRIESEIGPGLGNKATSRFGDPTNYGYFVEHGRGAGGAPPASVMLQWARRKLGLSGAAASRAAFAIGKKIAQEGTQPHPFLSPAGKRMHKQVIAAIEGALDAKIRELNSRRRT